MMAMLTINNLDFEVRDKKILNGLDLVLAEGEIHALLGA
ncbi:MAG: Fe-S cluster assembly ATPase SufC, partial [Gammaproteobacteria bacterium]|nr:Fe-S cluster assembly ATPase SufC [Gammaproteobacteria bacterium]